MSDIIKRRLKSLRQRETEKKERLEACALDLSQRAARNGWSIEMQREVDRPNDFAMTCRPMPLSFYYGEGSIPERDAEFMARRAQFYGHCAMAFGFEGWEMGRYSPTEFTDEQKAGGRDGRGQYLAPIDQTSAVKLNASSAPLEYLVSQGWLQSSSDPSGFANIRWAVALRFRDEVAGSQSGGLKGQNIEGAGGGFGPRLVSDYALDCMASVSAVREKLHPGLFRLLHMVVVEDVWIWEIDARRVTRRWKSPSNTDSSAQRMKAYLRRRRLDARRDRIILKLHKAIDGAAVVLRHMTEDQYRARWVKPRDAPASRR